MLNSYLLLLIYVNMYCFVFYVDFLGFNLHFCFLFGFYFIFFLAQSVSSKFYESSIVYEACEPKVLCTGLSAHKVYEALEPNAS